MVATVTATALGTTHPSRGEALTVHLQAAGLLAVAATLFQHNRHNRRRNR